MTMHAPRTCATVAVGLAFALIFTVGSSLAPPVAQACGVSGPDGAWGCSLAEHEESERLKWHLGASATYTSTRLRFSSALRGDEHRSTIAASLTYAPTRRLAFQASAGATVDGVLEMPSERFDLSPGPLVAVGASYRILEGRPFLIATAVLSFSAVLTRLVGQTGGVGYEAFNLRVGVLFGTTLWNVLSPYVLARAFGGPIFWQHAGAAQLGTDLYHVQLGAGVAVELAERFELFAEVSALGEQAASGGAAFAF